MLVDTRCSYSQWGSGGYPQPPEVFSIQYISIQYSVIGGKRKMVFRGLPRACWEFLFFRHQLKGAGQNGHGLWRHRLSPAAAYRARKKGEL